MGNSEIKPMKMKVKRFLVTVETESHGDLPEANDISAAIHAICDKARYGTLHVKELDEGLDEYSGVKIPDTVKESDTVSNHTYQQVIHKEKCT